MSTAANSIPFRTRIQSSVVRNTTSRSSDVDCIRYQLYFVAAGSDGDLSMGTSSSTVSSQSLLAKRRSIVFDLISQDIYPSGEFFHSFHLLTCLPVLQWTLKSKM